MIENLENRFRMSPVTRKRLFGAAAVMTIFSAWSLADVGVAQVAPRPPSDVTVHVPVKTASIYSVHVDDPFETPAVVALNGSGVPALGHLGVPSPGGNVSSTATYTLQGIMNGDPALAEFQASGNPNDIKILQVGDRLGDRKIVEIGAGTVVFDDGSRVAISAGDQAPVPNPPPVGSGARVPDIPTLVNPVAPPATAAPPQASTLGSHS
jgi:hypothetical protein